jgi:hypothetical protein
MPVRSAFNSIPKKKNVIFPCSFACTSADQRVAAVSVVVMDGITIGHPRCASGNCKTPLSTAQDRYCINHQSDNNICAIRDCGGSVVRNKLTCENKTHEAVESLYRLCGQSHFQLQKRGSSG